MTKQMYELVPYELRPNNGLNLNESALFLEDEEGSLATNFFYLRDAALVKRRGITLRSTAAAFNTKLVRLLGQFQNNALTVNHILASPMDNTLTTAGPLYYSTDGGTTWAACRTAALATPNVDAYKGLQYNDVFYIFSRTGGIYSWTGPDTLTAIAATPNGIQAAEVLDYLFTVDPATQAVRYSAAGTPTSWPAANSFQVGTGDGQKITSLMAYKDRLVIFQENSIFVLFLTGTPTNWQLKEISSTIGCTSIYASVLKDDWIYFISQSGVYRTNLGAIESVGDRIYNASFVNRNSIRYPNWGMWDSIGTYKNNIVVSLNTGGQLSAANRRHSVFLYNIVKDAWVQWTPSYASALGNNFLPWINMLEVISGRTSVADDAFPVGLYIGSGEFDGKTLYYGEGNTFASDNAVAFSAIYMTKFFNFEDTNSLKKVPLLFLSTAIPTGTSLQVKYQNLAGVELNTLTINSTNSGTQTYKLRGPGYVNSFRIQLTWSDAGMVAAVNTTLVKIAFLVRLPKPVQSKAEV